MQYKPSHFLNVINNWVVQVSQQLFDSNVKHSQFWNPCCLFTVLLKERIRNMTPNDNQMSLGNNIFKAQMQCYIGSEL